jgi:IclR family transcriptional regulator, KDG regulon repressor
MISYYHDVNKLMPSSAKQSPIDGVSKVASVSLAAPGAGRKRRSSVRPSSATMNAVKSVERALAILKTFDETSPFLTAQEIANRIGIPRPSVYRFLKTLCERNFLVEIGDAELKRFAIGSGLLGISRLAFGQGELRRVALPVMQLAADRSNESIYLSVRHGSDAVCVESCDAKAPLRYGGRVGNTYPLYAGSPKVILAFLDHELREHLIDQMTLTPITKNTITSRDELRRRLAAIRRRGFEISNGEMFPETCAISAPVFDQNDTVIAVLSIGAPRGRVNAKNKGRLAEIVLESARTITLGYRRQKSAKR